MFKRKLLIKIELCVAVVFLAGVNLYSSKTLAKTQPSPKQLVEEVWQIVQRSYVDASFNHHDWKAIGQQYLSRSYSSKAQAYAAIEEMVAKLGDRYTEFFEPQQYQILDQDTAGNVSGVGLEVAENKKTKALTVIEPIEGTPAFKAGILPGDVIIKIDGHPLQNTNVLDASNRILGPVGTKVVLTIQRGNQLQSFKLTRTYIALHPVSYKIQSTNIGNIGYIKLPEFTETAPLEMRQAIKALEKQHVQGYILDLRSDPGGLLDASLKIASMWLKKDPIVSLVDRNQAKDNYHATGHPLTNKPLVVLVDNDSASASEILAGALQDDKRAILVGTQTFGKGLVQSVEPLKDGSALKLTIAKYYTPNGRDINHVGIAPDTKVELTETQKEALAKNHSFATLDDPQYTSAINDLSQLIRARKNQGSSKTVSFKTFSRS